MASGSKPNHDYHILDPSPWPAMGSIGAFVMAIGAVGLMRWNKGDVLVLAGVDIAGWGIFAVGLAIVLATMACWWADTVKESLHGDHTPVVKLHLRYGMILFIASEVMFFVAWFWAYFDVALFPASVHDLLNTTDVVGQVTRDQLTGGHWPPAPADGTGVTIPATGAPTPGIFQHTFDPWHVPLLNTLILLTSGVTVTWAHHALQHGDRDGTRNGLILTILLGAFFTCLQVLEYTHAEFTYDGTLYGSAFFMATGFHGAHVLIGTIFLTVCLFRLLAGGFTPQKHFGFEAAAWYWHFVDVVWLFLFAFVYVAPHLILGH